MDASPDLPSPGWYRDPSGQADLRWWSGQTWSEATRASEPPAEALPPVATPLPVAPTPLVDDPLPLISRPGAVPETPAARLDLPRSRAEWRRVAASRRGIRTESPNTFAIWALAFLPIIALGYTAATVLVWREGSIWAAIVVQLTGLLVYLTFVVWDKVALARQRLLAPSLWWQLIPIPLLYFLLRRIILKKQGVISHAPGNVFVIVLVGSVVLAATTVTPLVRQAARDLAVQQFEASVSADFASVGTDDVTIECPVDAPLTSVGARFACAARLTDGTSFAVAFEVQPDLVVTQVPVENLVPRGVGP